MLYPGQYLSLSAVLVSAPHYKLTLVKITSSAHTAPREKFRELALDSTSSLQHHALLARGQLIQFEEGPFTNCFSTTSMVRDYTRVDIDAAMVDEAVTRPHWEPRHEWEARVKFVKDNVL